MMTFTECIFPLILTTSE